MDTEFRSHFPIFKKNKDLVYLDTAATAFKPKQVIDAVTDYYANYSANIHRGLYPIANRASKEFETARETVARFIGAHTDEIIFTSGTTEGVNLLASMFGNMYGDTEPSILLSENDHNSNLLPWRKVSENIIYLENTKEYNQDGNFNITSISNMSNVTGARFDIKQLRKNTDFLIVDASQSVTHTKLDVATMDIDALVFSAHKLYGPTGIGVLYMSRDLQKQLKTKKLGGGMVESVSKDTMRAAPGPKGFEAGTPHIAGAIGLAAAVDFINEVGFENIINHEQDLRVKLLRALETVQDLQIYHDDNPESGPVISVYHPNAHPHDIADFLGEKNVCVRAGHHCTQILHGDILKVPATVRFSIGMHNTPEDIGKAIDQLKEAISEFS